MSNTIKKNDLLESLKSLASKSDAEWTESLPQRKLAELKFHDRARTRKGSGDSGVVGEVQPASNAIFYSTAGKSQGYATDWIENNSPGKIFLDYACGDGGNAILAARSGADLSVGIDLSRVSVDNARRIAGSVGVAGNTVFVQGDCENTGLPDSSFDVAVCSGMLHHLDLDKALPELARIIKPGGVCLCVEALAYNPFIQLYRILTPHLRTDWEKGHILKLSDLRRAGKYFEVREVRYWHIASVLVSPLKRSRYFNPLLSAANWIDSFLTRIWPIRMMAWVFTFVLRKGPVKA